MFMANAIKEAMVIKSLKFRLADIRADTQQATNHKGLISIGQ